MAQCDCVLWPCVIRHTVLLVFTPKAYLWSKLQLAVGVSWWLIFRSKLFLFSAESKEKDKTVVIFVNDNVHLPSFQSSLSVPLKYLSDNIFNSNFCLAEPERSCSLYFCTRRKIAGRANGTMSALLICSLFISYRR